jgi:alpha-galactosidase
MPKITFIGAGSVVFTRNLCSDILLAPTRQESTIALMDIDPERLVQPRDLVQAIESILKGVNYEYHLPCRTV